MNYFAKADLKTEKKNGLTYIVLEVKDEEEPELTEQIIQKNQQYREFCSSSKAKSIEVSYSIYKTEENVTNAMQPEAFESFIEHEKAEWVGSGEFFVTKRKKKRKASTGVVIFVAAMCAILFTTGGLIIGKNVFSRTETEKKVVEDEKTDGLIIPQQNAVNADAEQITVSIDRSYSAVPMEDLQLKAEVVDGKAKIELPEFDKTDYFTHVPGYSWGFSTAQDGTKIEYYGGKTYEFEKDVKLYRVLVKYGGGSGTKEDPYLIDYYDQLELLAQEKAKGYFKQTADIVFPDWAEHTPIDTVSELKDKPDGEFFSYDGGGYCIDKLKSPLFGTVSGALIQNVNIRNGVIVSYDYKNLGAIVCDARNYRYQTEDGTSYETGETIIRHCSVSHTSITPSIFVEESATEHAAVEAPETEVQVIPAETISYDENGNVIEPTAMTEPDPRETLQPSSRMRTAENAIGAITGIGGQIESCYVTDFGIFANQENYYLYAGGISGKPANVMDSAVYYYSAQGKLFYAGGIVGSAEGCRQYNAAGKELPEVYGGNIRGCLARNLILTAETAAGGIAGLGASDAEAPMICNCYANDLHFTVGEYDADKVLVTAGFAGGVIGMDGKGKNGHLLSNTVSLADLPVIGQRKSSAFDDTVRQAPDYAFYQESILSVLNANSVHPSHPKEIFTGTFMFGENGEFGDETGSLAYPVGIADLFAVTADAK